MMEGLQHFYMPTINILSPTSFTHTKDFSPTLRKFEFVERKEKKNKRKRREGMSMACREPCTAGTCFNHIGTRGALDFYTSFEIEVEAIEYDYSTMPSSNPLLFHPFFSFFPFDPNYNIYPLISTFSNYVLDFYVKIQRRAHFKRNKFRIEIIFLTKKNRFHILKQFFAKCYKQ